MTTCSAPRGYALYSRIEEIPSAAASGEPAASAPDTPQGEANTQPVRDRTEKERAGEPRTTSWAAWFGLAKVRTAQTSHLVVHVRLDGFFASIEQVLMPEWTGAPVLVGASTVVSASREAARCGVRTGMRLLEALRLCPEARVIPGRWLRYAEFAERIRRILERYAPIVEADGADAFYLDFSAIRHIGFDVTSALPRLQADILSSTGLRASIGCASARSVAALASHAPQPGTLRMVTPGTEKRFLESLPADALEGLTPSQRGAFKFHGISTLAQLGAVPKPVLISFFGESAGKRIWQLARGRDPRQDESPRGLLSRSAKMPSDSADSETARDFLGYLVERVTGALKETDAAASSVGLRVCYADGCGAHRALRLPRPASGPAELLAASRTLLEKLSSPGRSICLLTIEVKETRSDRRQQAFGEKSKPCVGARVRALALQASA